MTDHEQPDVVGPSFWLKKGIELRSGAITARIATAKSLTTAVAWFWSAYTGVALVGVSIANRRFGFGHALCLALPAVLLLAAYGASLWSQSHVAVRFIPQSPKSVETAYDEISIKLGHRLVVAAIVTGAAILSVAGAIVMTATSTPSDTSSPPKLGAVVIDRGTPQQRLLIDGTALPTSIVLVEIRSTAGSTVAQQVITSDAQGHWSTTMPCTEKTPFVISATWKSGKMETRLQLDSAE